MSQPLNKDSEFYRNILLHTKWGYECWEKGGEDVVPNDKDEGRAQLFIEYI